MNESTATKKATAKAEESEAEKAAKAREKKIAAGQCVVDSDFHVGRAVNGLVCSYHAMHYDANGNRRS
jgi:hypothetical protein